MIVSHYTNVEGVYTNKMIKKSLSVLLVFILLITAYPFALTSFALESEEAEFFNLMSFDDSSLESAISDSNATGNWIQAKEELLDYYKNKFFSMIWIKSNTSTDGSQKTIVHDMLTIYENYLNQADVSTDSTWVDISLSKVYNSFVLTTYKHSENSGIIIGSKESGNAPKLVV